MLIQAKLRITELVNSGNKVIAIKTHAILETPAIKYAVGMPNTIEIPVTNETLIVRQKIETL